MTSIPVIFLSAELTGCQNNVHYRTQIMPTALSFIIESFIFVRPGHISLIIYVRNQYFIHGKKMKALQMYLSQTFVQECSEV